MARRFHYTPAFDVLKAAIIARDSRKVDAVLRRQPNLGLFQWYEQELKAMGIDPDNYSTNRGTIT